MATPTENQSSILHRRLLLSYGVLVAAAALAVVGAEFWPKGHLFVTYGPNVAAEILGILVTLLLVERILVFQRRREMEPIREVAFRRAERLINDLLQVLAYMYKAATDVGAKREPTTPSDLLEVWDRESSHLDFATDAPILPRRSWAAYAGESFTRFEAEALADLGRYTEVLGADYLVAVEELVADPVVSMMKLAPAWPQIDLEIGMKPGPQMLLALNQPRGSLNSPLRQAFAQKVVRLVAVFEQVTGEKIDPPRGIWGEHTDPQWGASRR